MEELKNAWNAGTDVTIPANTHLGLSYTYPSHGIFISSGIVREYCADKKGNEHTLRFIQNPHIIAPPLNNVYSDIETELLSHTLTPIEGRIWELSFMMNQAEQNPLFFRSIISIMCEAAYIKQRNDIRRNACTATERYLLFLEEFPGLVNQVALKYVASYLKMTPETISRIRNELSK